MWRNPIISSLLVFTSLIFSSCETPPASPNDALECRINSDCPIGQLCEEALCIADELTIEISECEENCPCDGNGDCGAGEGCDLLTKECFILECVNNPDCNLGEVCLMGRCATDLESDHDRDSIADNVDNCPNTANSDQDDLDSDGLGDACDDDADGDGVYNSDNCPLVNNPVQGDADQNGIGNLCDAVVLGTNVIGQIDLSGVQLGNLADTIVTIAGTNDRASVDEAGYFKFNQILRSDSAFTLNINRPGYETRNIPEVANLSLVDFNLGLVTLVPKQVSVSGVIQLEGRPLDGRVQLRLSVGGGRGEQQQHLTDDLGQFSIETFAWTQTLTASREGYIPQSWLLSWDQEQQEFFVTLEDGTIIPLMGEGSLPFELKRRRDAQVSGQLVPSRYINNYDWSAVQVKLIEIDGSEEYNLVVNETTQTFSRTGLAIGLYRFEVIAPGYAVYRDFVRLMSGTEPDELRNINLILQQDGQETAIFLTGRIHLAGQSTHGGIEVRAMRGEQQQDRDVTTIDGIFSLRLSALDYQLRFNIEGYESQVIEVVWNEEDSFFVSTSLSNDLIFTQEPPQSPHLELTSYEVNLTVNLSLLPSWLPQDQGLVQVRLNNQRYSLYEEGAQSVTFNNVPTGQYLLNVNRSGFRSEQRVIELNPTDLQTVVEVDLNVQSLAESGLDLSTAEYITDAQLRRLPSAALQQANLSGVTIRAADNSDLTSANLCGLNFEQTNLSGAQMIGVNLQGAILRRAILNGVNLRDAQLQGADLSHADLFNSNLNNVNLSNGGECNGITLNQQTSLLNANLTATSFVNAQFNTVIGEDELIDVPSCESTNDSTLDSPDFRFARWSQTDLTGANLSRVLLNNSIINNVELVNADLRGSCLKETVITRSNLSDVKLNYAFLKQAAILDSLMIRVQAHHSNLTGVEIAGVNLSESSFNYATALAIDFSGCIFDNASFEAANLSSSSWVGALLSNVDFRAANFATTEEVPRTDMKSVEMIDVNVEAANFNRVDLRNSQLSRINFTNVDLRASILDGANLSMTRLEGADLSDAQLIGTDFKFAVYDTFTPRLSTIWPSDFDYTNINALGRDSNLNWVVFPNNFNASGVNLSGADLSFSTLSDINLSNANLTNVNLTQATLSGDMRGTNWNDITLFNTKVGTLKACPDTYPDHLRCIGLSEDAEDSELEYAFISSTIITLGVDFREVDLANKDFDSKTFRNCNFSGMDLNNVDFSGTDLGGSSFQNVTNAHGIIFNDDTICPNPLSTSNAGCGIKPSPCSLTSGGCPDIEWVTIEGGSFQLGSYNVENSLPEPRQVQITNYQIMKNEVTVGQYKSCINAGYCSIPVGDGSFDGGNSNGSGAGFGGFDGDFDGFGGDFGGFGGNFGGFGGEVGGGIGAGDEDHLECNWEDLPDEHPIVCVTWSQLRAFGEWVGADLPSESQWAYAARSRGLDDPFPWGSSPQNCENSGWANLFGTEQCQFTTTFQTCSIPNGNTRQEVCDMMGNVAEWVLDDFLYYNLDIVDAVDDGRAQCIRPNCTPRTHIIRGGNILEGDLVIPYDVRTRLPMVYNNSFKWLGGRLARIPSL